MEKRKRLQETIDWARRIHWGYTLLPTGWKAYIVAFCLGGISSIVALSKQLPWYSVLIVALASVAIVLTIWAVVEKKGHTEPSQSSQTKHDDAGWFAFEVAEQVHTYVPFELFIRNCGPTFARNIRFDPIESRHGLKLWLDGIASLAPGEHSRVGYRAGENREYLGTTGHVVNFFEGGSTVTNQPPYRLTVHFLDGSTERTEKHAIEGHPLPKGGITFKTYPVGGGLARTDYEDVLSIRNELQSFMDELGPEPRANFRLAHDEFTQNLEEVGRYERKLTHGFQLRFSSRIQILIHRLGEKNIEEADLTLGMRQPPKTLETLTQIRNGLSTLVSDLRPRE